MSQQIIKSISSAHSEVFLTCSAAVGNNDPFAAENSGGYYAFRPNCHIEPLISGQVTLGKLADLIESATSSIDILIWGFDPSLRLRRDGTPEYDARHRLGTLLAKRAREGIKVRVRCYALIGASIRALNITGLAGSAWNSLSRKKDIIDELNSIQSPTTYIATWYLLQQNNKLNIDYLEITDPKTANSPFFKQMKQYHKEQDERQIQAYQAYRAQTGQNDRFSLFPQQNYYEWAKTNRVESRHDIFPEAYFTAEALLEYASTPHQKMVLVDYEKPADGGHEPSALIMGNNLKLVDWDRPEHRYEDNDRDGGPRQDIACHIKGPILNDINHNFEQVYNGINGATVKLQRPLLPAVVTNKAEYQHALQLCRTYIENNETAIHHLYTNIIAHLDDYLYIENQYFRHDKLASRLAERMKYLRNNGSDKSPHIFLVINPAGATSRATTEETLAKLAKGPAWEEAKKTLDPGEAAELEALGIKISLCTLATSGQKRDFWGSDYWDYAPIDIHTKVMISDDDFFTIGSANLNYRSMMADNELNVACHNEQLPEEFRHQLMGKHMGEGYSDEFTIEELFEEWEGLRIENDSIVKAGKAPLEDGSFIVSYDDSGWLKWRAD